ncbi:MAG: ABC transporter permease [Candidatus Tectimicrobiota bacterium]
MRPLAWPVLGLPCLALSLAGALGALLIWASGASVLAAYGGLLTGMLGSRQALAETCVAATPYLFTGLAVGLGFRAGLFNIGAEGQMYMGALAAAVAGSALPEVPGPLHLPLALAAGALGGACWGAIPGVLKAYWGTHEVINTIMLNHIAFKIVDYLVKHPLRDPLASIDRTPTVLASAVLPPLFGADYRVHAGFVLALAAVVLAAWMVRRTTLGFALCTVGANPLAARYAGIAVAPVLVATMALSGLCAGLAGTSEVLGLYQTLPAVFSTGYGFDAIAVALLARASLLGIIPAALLWGGLRNGAGLMQVETGVSIDVIHVIQALVVVCLAADRLLDAARQRLRRQLQGAGYAARR